MAISVPQNPTKKHEYKSVELYEEKGQYYLKLVYTTEDDREIKEITIPRIKLPVNDDILPNIDVHHDYDPLGYPLTPRARIKCGYGGDLQLEKGKVDDTIGDVYYVVKVLEEKTHELTVAEIEKKLGYKVKIVSDKK